MAKIELQVKSQKLQRILFILFMLFILITLFITMVDVISIAFDDSCDTTLPEDSMLCD